MTLFTSRSKFIESVLGREEVQVMRKDCRQSKRTQKIEAQGKKIVKHDKKILDERSFRMEQNSSF
jgi:hypothetical protein